MASEVELSEVAMRDFKLSPAARPPASPRHDGHALNSSFIPDGTDPGWESIAARHGFHADTTLGRRACFSARSEVWGCVPAHFLNLLSSLLIAAQCLLSLDSVLGCLCGVGSTLLYWYYAPGAEVKLDWMVISLAVIFPITGGIGMGFKRRERALAEFGTMFGNLRAVWGAAHTWTVEDKSQDSQSWTPLILLITSDHNKDDMKLLFDEFWGSLVAYLNVPRARAHHVFACGAAENRELEQASSYWRLSTENCICRMVRMVQHLKSRGLAPGEAHRLDQYLCKAGVSFEKLCALKEYRTPQAFRAFARVYILMIGWLYGPYYCYLGNLYLALAFAMVIQLVLSALFAVMLGLEDPFTCTKVKSIAMEMDDVQVHELVDVARKQLLTIRDDAMIDWHKKGRLITANSAPGFFRRNCSDL